MNEKEFIKLCKEVVANYANKHIDKTDGKQVTEDDVFIVWMCKTLQNNKALVSTTLFDGMYYELTYNGDKNEIYVDAYKKWENYCIEITCRNCSHAHKVGDIQYDCDAEGIISNCFHNGNDCFLYDQTFKS
jgi:hypothetical protein